MGAAKAEDELDTDNVLEELNVSSSSAKWLRQTCQ